MAKLTH